MAKIKAPMFGLEAKGTISDAITFTSWRGRPYVRINSKRKNPRSQMQTAMRSLTSFQAEFWSNLTAEEQQSWFDKSKKTKITLLNAQLKDSQLRSQQELGWRRDLITAPLPFILNPTISSAEGSYKSIFLTWNHPPSFGGDYSTAIYIDFADPLTVKFKELAKIVPVTDTKTLLLDLINGKTYNIRVRETGADGRFGLLSSFAEATPTA